MLFQGKVTKLPLCNGEDGAIALHNLSASEPIKDVPLDQLYSVPSVLKKMGAFGAASFTALGWDAESDLGYTIQSLFAHHEAHVEWILTMGDMEQKDLLPKATVALVNALADIERRVAQIYGDPDPASAALNFVLPFGGAYDNTLKSQKTGA